MVQRGSITFWLSGDFEETWWHTGSKIDYEEMVEKIKIEIQQKRQITLAEVRDMMDTTRKYTQTFLEHLDAIGIAMHNGDARKLRK